MARLYGEKKLNKTLVKYTRRAFVAIFLSSMVVYSLFQGRSTGRDNTNQNLSIDIQTQRRDIRGRKEVKSFFGELFDHLKLV